MTNRSVAALTRYIVPPAAAPSSILHQTFLAEGLSDRAGSATLGTAHRRSLQEGQTMHQKSQRSLSLNTRFHLAQRAVIAAAITIIAGSAACGAKVVVDGTGLEGEGGTTNTSTGAGLSCGEEPNTGKVVGVCVSGLKAGDGSCPAPTRDGLLVTLSEAMKVCAQTSPGVCCGQAALVQVVCELEPNGDECCYHAHYFEAAGCN
jgi:hypothetical protein